MAKKNVKDRAQKRARQAMKKRSKEKQRYQAKLRSGVAVSENAVQHQMLSEFGSVENFVRNVGALAGLLRTDEELVGLRFDPEKVYGHFDLAADRGMLADAYAEPEDFTSYSDDFADAWRDKRRVVLKELVDDEFVARAEKLFSKLMLTKKGHKKEYRAVLAGHLLAQSQKVAMSPTEAPLEDNNLWELLLLAAVKENPKDLPEPTAETETSATDEPAIETEDAAPQGEESVAATDETIADEPDTQE